MGKQLVIVESPTKAKTIAKMLGRNYKVMASVGHLRDLPKSTLGIDTENHFEPKYITIRGKGPIVDELKKAMKRTDGVILATDPDREGEAISWHISHLLKLDPSDEIRVEFTEITKGAVKEAIKKPRAIKENLVEAQQARRVLDRLVGYKISPLLWQKVHRGLSAGRVQSVAVKLICDREREIDAFEPVEYWSVVAQHEEEGIAFESTLERVAGEKKKLELKNKEQTDAVLQKLDKKKFVVRSREEQTRNRAPYVPFTTSTLQQEASRKLRFSTRKTIQIAQQLYEGIDLGEQGTEGIISYMRTDSIRISDLIVAEAKEFITHTYGKEYSNGGKNYTGKRKGSQDAHEAIRPTSVHRTPKSVESKLTKDQFKLYELIWERLVASQMANSVYLSTQVVLDNNGYEFRATGNRMKFDGFQRVYPLDTKENELPMLEPKQRIQASKIDGNQHFTKPPARYTVASLIKQMERLGIGRPSTYSPTLSTIQTRRYVTLQQKVFQPTELGYIVNDILTEYFPTIVDPGFTADLETDLDKVAEGDAKWNEIIEDFYARFKVQLEKAEEEVKKIQVEDEKTDEICPKCGKPIVIKRGRYGKFKACTGFPDCNFTRAIVKEIGVDCPRCNSPMVERVSKRGRVFYGCSSFPKCNYATWYKPTGEVCPECKEQLLVEKVSKKGTRIVCNDKGCSYNKK
jgi:DNA topoisomerase-1